MGDLLLGIPAQDNPFTHRDWLMQAAEETVGTLVNDAQRAFAAMPGGHGITWPNGRPGVDVVTSDATTTQLVLRYPCMAGQEDGVGQTILEGYWALRSAAQDARLAEARSTGTPAVVMQDARTVP